MILFLAYNFYDLLRIKFIILFYYLMFENKLCLIVVITNELIKFN